MLLSAVAIGALGLGQAAPLPPYHRVVTHLLFGKDMSLCPVSGQTLYTSDKNRCVAVNLLTLKTTWSTSIPGTTYVSGVYVAGNLVLAAASGNSMGDFKWVALDGRTGKQRWALPATGRDGPVARLGRQVFLGLAPHRLSAVDVNSHHVDWTTKLPVPPTNDDGGEVDAIAATPYGLVVNSSGSSCGVDPKSGAVRWTAGNSYVSTGHLAVLGAAAWLPGVCVDIRTGHRLWESGASNSEFAGVMAGCFVGLGAGRVAAVDAKSGHTIWTHQVGRANTSGGGQFGRVIGNLLFVRGDTTAEVIAADGKTLWHGDEALFVAPPIYADASHLVCCDGGRVMVYKHGSPKPLPADPGSRRRLAAQMAAHFKELDAFEINRLTKLGNDAFPAVLAAFTKACAAYDAHRESASLDSYSEYHEIGDVLLKITRPERTPELLAALKRLKGAATAKPFLLELIGRYGDPNVTAPFFVAELEHFKTPGWEMYESNTYVARQYLEASSAPVAIAFWLKQLRDPKADPTLRESAYDNLARTGGAEGLKAVLAERHQRKLLPPLPERVVGGFLGAGEFGTVAKLLHERTDSTGRTWGLMQCGVLGSAGDLWLVEKVGGKWADPLFTGVSLNGISRWVKNPPPEPTIGGKTAKQLADGAWFDILVNNPDIRKDTAGSGMTDLEKKRLGLDISTNDTDGDGDPDTVDPWPNAPQRPLTDAEQFLAAVFEARYHFDDSQGPALFYAPWPMKPFEMAGRNGPTIWVPFGEKNGWSKPLEQCYEQGVALINIAPRGSKPPAGPDDVIEWNADKTEGTVTISTYYGGLNGTGYTVTARKFGDTWVVISMHMAYVS